MNSSLKPGHVTLYITHLFRSLRSLSSSPHGRNRIRLSCKFCVSKIVRSEMQSHTISHAITLVWNLTQEEWKKYKTYTLAIDPENDDKAIEIQVCDFSRPHMRAFHCAWVGFFIAFFIWFAIAPLLSEIRDTFDFSDSQIWTSNIVSVGGTIVMRFVLGPLCDKLGARILFTIILCLASIPTACTGLSTPLRVCMSFACSLEWREEHL